MKSTALPFRGFPIHPFGSAPLRSGQALLKDHNAAGESVSLSSSLLDPPFAASLFIRR